MITRRELCEKVGVTRKTLIHYKDERLLEPSNLEQIIEAKKKHKKVPWLYDDDAADKLMLIRIFKEVGYSLAEIKTMLEMKKVDTPAELDKMVDALTAKKTHIEGLIKYLTDWKIRESLPQLTREVLNRLDDSTVLKDGTLNELFDEVVSTYASTTEVSRKLVLSLPLPDEEKISVLSETILGQNKQKEESVLLLYYQLVAIAFLKGEDPNSEIIHKLIEQALSYLLEGMTVGMDEEGTRAIRSMSESEQAAELFLVIDFLYSIPDYKEVFDKYFEYESVEFVLTAIRAFGKNHCKERENFDQLLLKMKEDL